MINQFFELFDKQKKLTLSEREYIKDNAKIKFYKKNEMIFNEGAISNTIYFVLGGCVRLFYNVNKKEKTAYFYTEGKLVSAGESFANNVPSRENFQALENTFLIHLSKQTIENLNAVSPNFKQLILLNSESELISYQKLIASFITLSAEGRYNELFKTNRDLFQRVSQKHIASYLGISPETLSRIKRKSFDKLRNYAKMDYQELLKTG